MSHVAVVTGASRGIGEAISQKLLNLGYKVYGISRTPPKISDNKFVWIKADLTRNTDIRLISEQLNEARIHVLVNVAGTAIKEDYLHFNYREFEKIFGINFVAPIRLTLCLFSRLSSGVVINISSLADRFPDGLYGSSKAALNNYTETIALEPDSPKIISLLPSYVDTPLLRSLHPDEPDSFWENANSPGQVAESIRYILENLAAVQNGSRIIVINSRQDDGDYDPEKLWLFLTDKKELKRLK